MPREYALPVLFACCVTALASSLAFTGEVRLTQDGAAAARIVLPETTEYEALVARLRAETEASVRKAHPDADDARVARASQADAFALAREHNLLTIATYQPVEKPGCHHPGGHRFGYSQP